MAVQPESNEDNSNPIRDRLRIRRDIEQALRAVPLAKKCLPANVPARGNGLLAYVVHILFLEEALTAWDHKNYEEAARMFSHARDILGLDGSVLRACHEACKQSEPRERGIDPS